MDVPPIEDVPTIEPLAAQSHLERLKQSVQQRWQESSEGLGDLLDGAVEVVDGLGVAELAGPLVERAASLVPDLAEKAGEALGAAAEAASSLGEALPNLGSVAEGLGGLAEGLGEVVGGVIGDALSN